MGLRRERKVDIKSLSIDGTNIDDSIAELAALDGLTANTTELNYLDTSEAGTAVASKALVLGANKNVDTLAIAASGLKIGSGAGTAVTATAAELNTLAGVSAGTAKASAAAVLGAQKNLDVLTVAGLTATIATPISAATPMTTGFATFTNATPPVSAATPTAATWSYSLVVQIGGSYYGMPLFAIATPW